jgi:hypothetical protein
VKEPQALPSGVPRLSQGVPVDGSRPTLPAGADPVQPSWLDTPRVPLRQEVLVQGLAAGFFGSFVS